MEEHKLKWAEHNYFTYYLKLPAKIVVFCLERWHFSDFCKLQSFEVLDYQRMLNQILRGPAYPGPVWTNLGSNSTSISLVCDCQGYLTSLSPGFLRYKGIIIKVMRGLHKVIM